MPIQTNCPGCGRQLQVDDEHAGKRARCPECGTICIVGEDEDSSDEKPAAAPSAEQWMMKTPEGQVYGPVSTAVLDEWLADGRISSDCFLRAHESETWRPADEVYGVLSSASRPVATNPFSTAAATGSTASLPAQPPGTDASAFMVPHRGGIILMLGIVSWLTCCPVFSLMAWMMGASDLREMRNGRMDPGGTGLTQAGHIMGVILSVFWLVLILGGAFLLLLAAVGSMIHL